MTRVSEANARFTSRDPEERRRATTELLGVDPDLVAELVSVALSDEDWRVRKEGVVVALALSPNPVVLRCLVAALYPSDNVGFRNAAVEALGGFGEAAVDALAVALPELDADGRKLAVEALGRVGEPSALRLIASLLDDPEANVRAAAAEAVGTIGIAGIGEATPLLEKCLFSAEPLIALAALQGLNALGSPLSWSSIERCLEVPSLRRAALLAAGRSGEARAAPVLVDALGKANGAGFSEIVSALRELAREKSVLSALLDCAPRVPPSSRKRLIDLVFADDADEDMRRAALVVAAALGFDEASHAAVIALSDDRFLAEAHEALELLGARAVPALIEATRSDQAVLRSSSLGLLSRLKDAPPSVVIDVARDALKDPLPEVQREALAVLSRFGDASSVQELARYLALKDNGGTAQAAEDALAELAIRHPDVGRRLAANAVPDREEAHAACVVMLALGQGTRGSLDADVAFLSAALANPSPSVRRAAIEALAEVGGSRGVEAIAFALADEERAVRAVAVAALGSVRGAGGSAPGLSHLVDLVKRSQEVELVAEAIRALGETHDSHAVSVLRPLTRAVQPLIAVSAVEALAKLVGNRFDALLDGLAHVDAEVVKATMLALSDTTDPRVVAHLGACLDHEAWDVRRLAADLMGRVPGDAALAMLRARLTAEESPPVYEAITRALERIAGVRRTPLPGSLRPR